MRAEIGRKLASAGIVPCIGLGGLYFTAKENACGCNGKRIVLNGFWHGGAPAIICARHATMFLDRERRGYLAKRLIEKIGT